MTGSLRRLTVVLLGLLLLVAACGKSETEKKPEDKTPAEKTLAFGEAATFPFEVSPERTSDLEVTVTGVREGTVADLAGYNLDERTKTSTPFYADVTVKNVGNGDVGGAPLPLLAVSEPNTLIQASTFTNAFATCPSTPLPASFPPNTTVTTCLMFLAADHGTVTGVGYRPAGDGQAITWKGEVTPPKAADTEEKPAKDEKEKP